MEQTHMGQGRNSVRNSIPRPSRLVSYSNNSMGWMLVLALSTMVRLNHTAPLGRSLLQFLWDTCRRCNSNRNNRRIFNIAGTTIVCTTAGIIRNGFTEDAETIGVEGRMGDGGIEPSLTFTRLIRNDASRRCRRSFSRSVSFPCRLRLECTFRKTQ